MKTGELAKRAGVNIQTVRFYERKRLLPEPSRTPSGYRCYTDRDLRQIQFIRECQEIGFTLQEIKQLAELHAYFATSTKNAALDGAKFKRMMEITGARLTAIDNKLQLLGRMREQLSAMIPETRSGSMPVCPVRRSKQK